MVSHTKAFANQPALCLFAGNYEDGNYRITTFQNYPDKNPSRRKALALSGFYYTGFKDRVRCYRYRMHFSFNTCWM